MLVIPISDFTKDVEAWLDKASKNEIIIEKDGKPFLTLSRAKQKPEIQEDKNNIVNNLFGVLKGLDLSRDDIKAERLQNRRVY
ncbi:hypothetical protein MASR2M29_03630 [Spirochaetota bacterium]